MLSVFAPGPTRFQVRNVHTERFIVDHREEVRRTANRRARHRDAVDRRRAIRPGLRVVLANPVEQHLGDRCIARHRHGDVAIEIDESAIGLFIEADPADREVRAARNRDARRPEDFCPVCTGGGGNKNERKTQ